MRKAKLFVGIMAMVMFALCSSILMGGQTDFSGVWILDKGKSRPLPHEPKNYTLTVTQTEQQLTVDNQVEGNVQPQMTDSSLGGNMVDVGASRPTYRPGTLALSVNVKATFSLDGKETTNGSGATLKAKWSKDGKGLELSMVMKNPAQAGQGAEATIKERWTLAEGGEALKVQRSVTDPGGTDVVNLVFRKANGKH